MYYQFKNTNSNFYKIFMCIYFLRWEIKTGIADINFRVFFKNPQCQRKFITLTCISNLIKNWFNSSKQNTLEHVKHNKALR